MLQISPAPNLVREKHTHSYVCLGGCIRSWAAGRPTWLSYSAARGEREGLALVGYPCLSRHQVSMMQHVLFKFSSPSHAFFEGRSLHTSIRGRKERPDPFWQPIMIAPAWGVLQYVGRISPLRAHALTYFLGCFSGRSEAMPSALTTPPSSPNSPTYINTYGLSPPDRKLVAIWSMRAAI